MEVKIDYNLIGNPIKYYGFEIKFEPWIIHPEDGIKLEANVESNINLLGDLKKLGSVHFFQSVWDMKIFWSEMLGDDDLWDFLIRPSEIRIKGKTFVEWVEYAQDIKEQTGYNGYARVIGYNFFMEPVIEKIPCVNGLEDAKETILHMVNTIRQFQLQPWVRAGELVAYRELAFNPNKRHELMIVESDYPEGKMVGVIALHKYDVNTNHNWKDVAGDWLSRDLEKYNGILNKYWTWKYTILSPYRREIVQNTTPLTDEQLEQEVPNIFKTIDQMIEENKKYFN